MTIKYLIKYLGKNVTYQNTWQEMQDLTNKRTTDDPDQFWVLEHAPVYTLGVAGLEKHILNRNENIPIIRTDRGGQVTYHGPGQIVIYTLIDLRRLNISIRELVMRLEKGIINYLLQFDIKATSDRLAPGVYVNGKKIASLGLKVRKGSTYHGISFNTTANSLDPFQNINVCGYEGLQVTHLAQFIPLNNTFEQIGTDLAQHIINAIYDASDAKTEHHLPNILPNNSSMINFTKMEALGNDFIVIDCSNQVDFIENKLCSEQIIHLCSRHYGIGADQLLIIKQVPKTHFDVNPITDNNYDFYYLIYNQDGSEALNCGNGARAIIKYIYKNYKLQAGTTINLIINHKKITGNIEYTKEAPHFEPDISVNLGSISFSPKDVGLNLPCNLDNRYNLTIPDPSTHQLIMLEFAIASLGNPHAIIMLHQHEFEDSQKLAHMGQLLQNSEYFQCGVNVNFCYQLDHHHILLKTYERGCGFTNACGSGAASSACYLLAQNICQDKVIVSMQGGKLEVVYHHNQVIIKGSANYVFEGQINL